jgi:ParB family chromosome partitioning protein
MTDHVTATIDEHQGEAPGGMRRRLGRGLSALLGGGPEEQASFLQQSAIAAPQIDPSQIHIELIERNPFQPRKDFEAESLHELVESIRQHGVLQPLLVRAVGNHYQLIAGERRLLASKQAGLESVPCRVLELDDQRVCEAALEENLKRQDLNVLEKAQAFQDYLQRFGSTMEELAKQLSMNRSTVNNYLRLLELPEAVKESLRADRITNGHARALLSLPEADQLALCKRIETEALSVRATESAVRELLGRNAPEPAAQQADGTIPFPVGAEQSVAPDVTNHVRSLQEQLQQQLGLKVEIKVTGKETGRIIIPFGSNDDFERIVRHLRNAA